MGWGDRDGKDRATRWDPGPGDRVMLMACCALSAMRVRWSIHATLSRLHGVPSSTRRYKNENEQTMVLFIHLRGRSHAAPRGSSGPDLPDSRRASTRPGAARTTGHRGARFDLRCPRSIPPDLNHNGIVHATRSRGKRALSPSSRGRSEGRPHSRFSILRPAHLIPAQSDACIPSRHRRLLCCFRRPVHSQPR